MLLIFRETESAPIRFLKGRGSMVIDKTKVLKVEGECGWAVLAHIGQNAVVVDFSSREDQHFPFIRVPLTVDQARAMISGLQKAVQALEAVNGPRIMQTTNDVTRN